MRRTSHILPERILVGILLLSGALLALAACGQQPFRLSHPTNDPGEIRRVANRLKQSVAPIKNAFGRPMAFMVATRPRGIVALDLESGKVLWRHDIDDLSSKIVVGKNFLFHRKGSTILMARHVRSGEVAWQKTFPFGNATEFFGMDADGDTLFYVATSTSVGRSYARFADLVKVDGSSGRVVWKKRANSPLGSPAARNGMVFVPFRFQYLSVLSGATGMEIARVRVQHETKAAGGGKRTAPILINYAWDTPEGLVFGNDTVGAIRFTSQLAAGHVKDVDFANVDLEQQRSVQSRYHWDGYKSSLVSYTAIDRNRLLWRFGQEKGQFLGNSAVLQFYRYFFGFEGKTGVLKWAYVHPATEVINAEHLGSHIAYVSREGQIVAMNAVTGDRVWTLDTGIRIHGVTFDANGFNPPPRNAEKSQPLLEVLQEIVRESDVQYQDAKMFAVTQMVNVKGPEISKVLLEIVHDAKTPSDVRRLAGDVLVERASAESLGVFLDALEVRYDFLKGVAPKGVGIVARALGRLGSDKAVPALLAHLMEPNTPVAALQDIVDALVRIGDRRAVWPFSQFLLMYRADADFSPHINILTTLAKTLLGWGGRAERQLLTFLLEDHHTLPQLQQFLRRELDKASL